MRKTWREMQDVATALGGELDNGINWTWATFPTEATATEFDLECRNQGYETRGVYSPPCTKESTKGKAARWGVRYR